MPTYVYRCKKCKRRFELFHSISDDTPRRCPRCRGKAERVPAGGAGLLFKGSGFYITDYRSKAYKEKAKGETAGGSATPGAKGSPGKTAGGTTGGSSGGSSSGGSSGGSSSGGGGASGGG